MREAAEQGDEADEAKHIGASQLIPGVGRTSCRATERTRVPGVASRSSRCLSSAAFTGSVQQPRAGAAVALSAFQSWVAWAADRLALQRGASSLLNVALALLKLKSRRSPATRVLSPRGGRGFQEATEGVALQRRLCS